MRAGTLEGELADWPEKHARLLAAFTRLEEAGYTLRSAYSAVRDPARHRFLYMEEQYQGADLLGLGASSFSYFGGIHHQNVPGIDDYLERHRRGRPRFGRAHVLGPAEQLLREFLLQMKLLEVDVAALEARHRRELPAHVDAPLGEFERRGWIRRAPGRITVLRSGIPHVDRMLGALYFPEHRGIRYS
jgi:oxygen-independent coproporphyrinogen-3 oxidase